MNTTRKANNAPENTTNVVNTKNKLSDLHDHLFEQLEWLGDRDLKGDELREEILRASAMCGVAEKIIANGNLLLSAHKARDNAINKMNLPRILAE